VPFTTRAVRDERGVAAVEFAIILPVLVMMLMGIIDWGFFFFFSESIVNAAREGARAGAVQEDSGDTESTAQSVAEAYLAGASIAVGTGANQATATASLAGSDLSVTVDMDDFSGLTGFLAPPLIPSSITYTSTMRWENAP
jgi:Flp pilus assembly protein TadG